MGALPGLAAARVVALEGTWDDGGLWEDVMWLSRQCWCDDSQGRHRRRSPMCRLRLTTTKRVMASTSRGDRLIGLAPLRSMSAPWEFGADCFRPIERIQSGHGGLDQQVYQRDI